MTLSKGPNFESNEESAPNTEELIKDKENLLEALKNQGKSLLDLEASMHRALEHAQSKDTPQDIPAAEKPDDPPANTNTE